MKSTLQILDGMKSDGSLDRLISDKVVSDSVLMHLNVINEFNASLKDTNSIMQSMEDISEMFGVSIMTIRRIRTKYKCS